MNTFTYKKIGIWGFGVVGTSALHFFDQFDCASIEILNETPINLPITKNLTSVILQNQINISTFFQNNDYILVSPGIPLHAYQTYHYKIISELDLFYQINKIPTIAITGSLGKTSITHLLSTILQKMGINTTAAGNIGYPMLNLVTEPISTDPNIKLIVLELSSFQLQQSRYFSSTCAIITNIYNNHLDHHASMDEYTNAKYNIFSKQNNDQKVLLPFELKTDLTKKYILTRKFIFFSTYKPDGIDHSNYIMYYLENKIIYKYDSGITTLIFDINQLAPITFQANWLVIIATLDIHKVSLLSLRHIVATLKLPNHRLQKIASINGSDFYNDSKSTVWQATLEAVQSMDHKPMKLFLGGLSKGADRTPLLQILQNKNLEIYAFGKEAYQLSDICKSLKIVHHAHATLQESFESCMKNIKEPSNILFSPAGSSYDLFENYLQRGQFFTKLVRLHEESEEKKH